MRKGMTLGVAPWGNRLSFTALLVAFSEFVVWQHPAGYTPLRIIGFVVVYGALAAIALDLIVRLRASDAASLLLIAGAYGLANGTLISQVSTRDLPVSLLVRPLGAQTLAFLGALAAFRLLLSGRRASILHLLVAAIVGLAWGVWVRWAPGASNGTIESAALETALVATGLALAVCLLLAGIAAREPVRRAEDWLLGPGEWIGAVAVLVAALAIGLARGEIGGAGAGIVLALIAFLIGMLSATRKLRGTRSPLDPITPPRAPGAIGWLAMIALFLAAGWIGHALPGSGDRAPQGDLLIGLLLGFGALWPPVVSALVGVQAFVQLAREQR